MSDRPTPCQHGRNFCMECHYQKDAPSSTLPDMYDKLSADYNALQSRLDAAEAELDRYQDMLQSTSLECGERLDSMERQLAERDAVLRRLVDQQRIFGRDSGILREAEALLSSAEPVSPWIVVAERTPDEHKANYLCLFEDGHQQVSEWLHDDTEGWCFWYGDPTHWMPLPDAPAKGGDVE